MSDYQSSIDSIKILNSDGKFDEYSVLVETGDTEGTLRLKIYIDWLKKSIFALEERIKKLEGVIGV